MLVQYLDCHMNHGYFHVVCRLEDAHGSLLSELHKWQRRHSQISSVVEQLKTKECRTVLAALVASKSRVLKKWRAIDLQSVD